jgi:rfaE bifunctional protein kinase chain/domain/rfaE bifunctional protein nucleotidyltransferase chain/domain
MITSSKPRLLIVGDVMLDLYTWGTAERVSPEAPVLVLKAEREEARLGGAGAVAGLLAALGAQALVAGLVGDDPAGRRVARLIADLGNPSVGNALRGVPPLADSAVLPLPSGEGWGEGATPVRSVSFNSQFSICNLQFSIPPLLTCSSRPTTVKERLLGQTAGRHGQQMLRVDRESCDPLSVETEERLRVATLAALDDVQAVLISDYGKGVCTPKLLSAVIGAARKKRLPVLVDPRRGADYRHYRWATVIKPNRREAAEATGREIRCLAEAFAAGKELCARWGFRAAVITLDADGLVLVTADGLQQHFGARDHEVADVTGAGDTVLAMLGAALSGGGDLPDACRLAVAAATLQVERLGVSPLSWREVVEETEGRRQKAKGRMRELGEPASEGNALRAVPLSAGSAVLPLPSGEGWGEGIPPNLQFAIYNSQFTIPSSPDGLGGPSSEGNGMNSVLRDDRVLSLDDLVPRIADHRQRGHKIVFTNGCFDLLHAGHLHCLTAAKAEGDLLVVALNSDAGVRRLKGASRPIVGQVERAAMLAALGCVDYVTIFDDDTPERLIAELHPDVLVKGAEARPAGIPGEQFWPCMWASTAGLRRWPPRPTRQPSPFGPGIIRCIFMRWPTTCCISCPRVTRK